MVYRSTWLVAAAMSLLALVMLGDLLKSSSSGLPWQPVVVAGLVAGVGISRTAAAYRLRGWTTGLAHVCLMIVVVLRLAAPDTLRFGVVPTLGAERVTRCDLAETTLAMITCRMTEAGELILNGADPFIPVIGLVIMATLVFWVMGALIAWGLSTGRPFLGLVPPFVVTLEFATVGRQSTRPIHVVGFVLLTLAGLLAVVRDEERRAGRLRANRGFSRRRSIPPSAGAALGLAVASLTTVVVLAPMVPREGLLQWRNPTMLTGDLTGSISFSPFVTIQQRLVDPQDVPLFTAHIEGEASASEVYFRLVTMDSYAASGRFEVHDSELVSVDGSTESDGGWEYDENSFFGPTAGVRTDVTIAALGEYWLPAAYAPQQIEGPRQLIDNLLVRLDDSSLYYDGGLTRRGLAYSLVSRVPRPDLAALVANADRELSGLFANAAADGEEIPEPNVSAWKPEPAGGDRYTALPEPDVDNRLEDVRTLASAVTTRLGTSYEKGLALERWFHSPFTASKEATDGFGYTTDITPGQGASDLAAWLLDPDSPNFHQGYCENFATAMAVMARTLGIPSRVVLGFTPGLPSPADPSTVTVTDANAHAWVELWMPSQGWVRFDPTPRSEGDTPQTFEALEKGLGFDIAPYLESSLSRRSSVPTTTDGPAGASTTTVVTSAPPQTTPPPGDTGHMGDNLWFGGSLPVWAQVVLWVVGVALVLVGSIPFVKWFVRRRRLRRLRNGDISAAWEQLVSRLVDLDEGPHPAATPTEVAHSFDSVVLPLADAYDRSLYGPEGTLDVEHIATAQKTLERTEQLITTRYSRRERLRALYRPRKIIPGAWTRRVRRRRHRN